ncbi:MAG TPA: DUF4382 domain-containing protein [Gemmatimonadales bacterium]
MTKALSVIAVAGMVACNDGPSAGGSGMTRVTLTDDPFPFESVESVNLYITSIAVSATGDTGAGTSGWTVIAEPRQRFDLLQLQNGNSTILGETAVPAGQYAAVRVVMNSDSSNVVLAGGAAAAVNWQHAGEITLNALVLQPLDIPAGGGDIAIDFDLGRAFEVTSASPLGFVFMPIIRAVNAAATGTIEGTVMGPDAAGDTVPVKGANVLVYGSACPPDQPVCPSLAVVAASSNTDANGHYALRLVNAGTYTAVVNSPPNSGLGSASTQVNVVAGQVTQQSFTIGTQQQSSGGPGITVYGATAVRPGHTGYIYALVRDASGDSVLNPSVTWQSRNTGLATVSGTGQIATVTGVALGNTWIVATSGTVTDSMVLAVRADSTTDSTSTAGNPVQSVTITPGSQTVNVGDSVSAFATLKDANGASLNGRTVTWTVSDASVAKMDVYGQSVLLHPLKSGSVTLTAVSEGKNGTATVTVH